jgi:hypothetical protein
VRPSTWVILGYATVHDDLAAASYNGNLILYKYPMALLQVSKNLVYSDGGAEIYRWKLSAACAAHARLGRASLILYDVTTLYFETDAGDAFREPGFSKERRLEPQITIGLLTDQSGFPLMVHAFEGNLAETKTILSAIRAFMTTHHLSDVTIVADAGMISEANQKDIEEAGLSFILGARIPLLPYAVKQWKTQNAGQDLPDGHIFTQPRPGGPTGKLRDQVIYYQYKADRARRTCAASTSRSPKPRKPSPGKCRSSGTGSSGSTAPPRASTGTWKQKPAN